MATGQACLCGLIALALAISSSAEPATEASVTIGQFLVQRLPRRASIYHDVCVSRFPALTQSFDKAVTQFRGKYDEAVAPVVQKYRVTAQYKMPVPSSLVAQFDQEENTMRTRLAGVDANSCAKFIENLSQLDVSRLADQLESSLSRLAQLPPGQLEGK